MTENEKKEEEWKAEEDARTLARGMAIMNDSDRMTKARAAAKRLLSDEKKRTEEQEDMTDALSQLARKGRLEYPSMEGEEGS